MKHISLLALTIVSVGLWGCSGDPEPSLSGGNTAQNGAGGNTSAGQGGSNVGGGNNGGVGQGAAGQGGTTTVATTGGDEGLMVGDIMPNLEWNGYVNESGIGLANAQGFVDYSVNEIAASGADYALLQFAAVF